MGNADVNQKLKNLQKRIKTFYTAGKTFDNKETAKKMWIKDNQLVVDKEVPVLPGEHLIRAQYKDVIERDGNIAQKINICLSSDIEMKKCDVMKKAAYSRDIRPEFECHLKTKSACFESVGFKLNFGSLKQIIAHRSSLKLSTDNRGSKDFN